MNRTAAIFAAAIFVICAIVFITTEPAEFDAPVTAERYAAECEGVDMTTESASVVSVIDDNVTVKTDKGELLAFFGDGFNVGDDVELLIDDDYRIIDAMLR